MRLGLPRTVTVLLTSLAIALAACGGDESAAVEDNAGTTQTAGSKAATDKTGLTSKAAPGTKKFGDGVCSLLTPAEVEAVVRTGTLTAHESDPDPSTDRSCGYLQAGVAPMVVLTLQGELEPVDWPETKRLPSAKTVSVRGAEAIFWPTTSVLYVYKNGLSVVVQVVVPPAGETYESAETKLVQPIADRLP